MHFGQEGESKITWVTYELFDFILEANCLTWSWLKTNSGLECFYAFVMDPNRIRLARHISCSDKRVLKIGHH